jgi:antitoxin YefM
MDRHSAARRYAGPDNRTRILGSGNAAVDEPALAARDGTVIWYRGEVIPVAMSASEARKRLFPLIEQVNDDQEPVEIVSKAGTAYLVSADQWRSLMETAHLLRSPANAERLLRSVADAEAGRTEVQDLIDPRHDIP